MTAEQGMVRFLCQCSNQTLMPCSTQHERVRGCLIIGPSLIS
jgi:hypothetical protein